MAEVAAAVGVCERHDDDVSDLDAAHARADGIDDADRLAAGDSPDQVIQYFVEKYGEWILLKPRRHGFNWLVWSSPLVATAIGLLIAGFTIRRWTRRRGAHATAAAPPAVDPAMRERIRREMELESER